MDGDRLIKAVYKEFDSSSSLDKYARDEMAQGMVEILEAHHDYFVAKNSDELRALALENTDLVEPKDE